MVTATRSTTRPKPASRGLPALVAGLVCLVVRAAHAEEPRAVEAPADAQTMAEARKHFQAGVNLLDDPDGARIEEAYHAFHRAYELSRSPVVLGNIGYTSLKLERDGEAIDAYTAYLRDAKDIDPKERQQIERDLATLTSTVATFTVSVEKPGSFVVVDTRILSRGAPVVNTYPFEGRETKLRLHPGLHSFKVKAADQESMPFEVTVLPATATAHAFTFAAPPRPAEAREAPRTSPSHAGPIVLGVLGVLSAGAGTAAALLARSKADEIANACPNDVCPRAYDLAGARTEAKTMATVADAAWIGGGAAVGASLLWLWLMPSSSPRRSGAIVPGAQVTAHGGGLEVGGRF